MIAAHPSRGLLLAGAVLLCAVAFVWNGLSAPARAAGQSPPDAERERLLAIGKDLFVARCASCHNERGDKPLEHGLPLNQRKLSREVIERNINGRFKSATAEQRRAVVLYIESFQTK
jgi:mono/diheme cytochrome c family protein